MERLFEQLEQCGIKSKFIQEYHGQWSPEVGAALCLYLTKRGLHPTLMQLQNFLADAMVQDDSGIEIDPIADSDMLAIEETSEILAEELTSTQAMGIGTDGRCQSTSPGGWIT